METGRVRKGEGRLRARENPAGRGERGHERAEDEVSRMGRSLSKCQMRQAFLCFSIKNRPGFLRMDRAEPEALRSDWAGHKTEYKAWGFRAPPQPDYHTAVLGAVHGVSPYWQNIEYGDI